MITPLIIEPTDETPGVILDPQKNVFEFSGRSLPEDAASFFEPIFKWLDEFLKAPVRSVTFCFKMDYFNTASSKYIQDILTKLEVNKEISIDWCYQKDDEDMLETGNNLADIINLPFRFISYK